MVYVFNSFCRIKAFFSKILFNFYENSFFYVFDPFTKICLFYFTDAKTINISSNQIEVIIIQIEKTFVISF